MALDDLTATIWAQELLRNLQKASVYASLCNRDYEGDIAQKGDTVKINGIGPVTVGSYTKDTDITFETLNDANQSLVIDQAKYFAFEIDDIDRKQNSPDAMSEALLEAAYALRDTADQFVAGKYTEAAVANLLGTTGAPKTDLATASVPYNYLVDLGVLLDNANVPPEDRWAVIPPWYHGYLLKDTRFTGNGTPQNVDVLANGLIGRAAGFDLYKSNNVPNTTATKYRIIAGHRMAWSFADQINKVEAVRREARFADAAKGLHLYGHKVTRPAALAVLTANPT